MRRYTLYAWQADDEGGIAVCLSKDWNLKKGYHPDSGWRARPSEKLGEFTTKAELKKLLQKSCADWYDSDFGNIESDTNGLWQSLSYQEEY